jgi:hypothetical protein
MRIRLRTRQFVGAGITLILALAAIALPVAASGAGSTGAGAEAQAAFCPFSASELSGIVGHKLQRVALGGGRPAGQCAFSAVENGSAVVPQIYLTLSPGNAADLRDSFRYYVNARAQLATKPVVKARPDLGPGAFTLTVADADVTNAFFLSGDNIASLSVDLSGAPRQDKQTVAQILALAVKRAP